MIQSESFITFFSSLSFYKFPAVHFSFAWQFDKREKTERANFFYPLLHHFSFIIAFWRRSIASEWALLRNWYFHHVSSCSEWMKAACVAPSRTINPLNPPISAPERERILLIRSRTLLALGNFCAQPPIWLMYIAGARARWLICHWIYTRSQNSILPSFDHA